MKTAIAIAVLVALAAPTAAQVRQIDAERLLTRLGFTSAEIAQARSGTAVARLLASDGPSDIGAFGVIKIDTRIDRLVYWLKDVSAFRKAAELGVGKRLSNPPVLSDFSELSI